MVNVLLLVLMCLNDYSILLLFWIHLFYFYRLFRIYFIFMLSKWLLPKDVSNIKSYNLSLAKFRFIWAIYSLSSELGRIHLTPFSYTEMNIRKDTQSLEAIDVSLDLNCNNFVSLNWEKSQVLIGLSRDRSLWIFIF